MPQYEQDRADAMRRARRISSSVGGANYNQADAAASRNLSNRIGANYSDYTNYPLDEDIIKLPQRQAEATARKNATDAGGYGKAFK